MKRLLSLLIAPLLVVAPICADSAPSYRSLNNLYLYGKLGGGVSSTNDGNAVVGGGFGIRAHRGSGWGWDLSVGGYAGDGCLAYARTLGLLYLFPRCNLSPYIGAGLGLGAIERDWFCSSSEGLLGELAVGLEWFWGKSFYVSSSNDNHCSYSRSTFPLLFFLELNLHQPAVVNGGYSPALTLEFGIGF